MWHITLDQNKYLQNHQTKSMNPCARKRCTCKSSSPSLHTTSILATSQTLMIKFLITHHTFSHQTDCCSRFRNSRLNEQNIVPLLSNFSYKKSSLRSPCPRDEVVFPDKVTIFSRSNLTDIKESKGAVEIQQGM